MGLVTGVDRWELAIDKLLGDMDYAVRRAVSTGALATKTAARANVGGPPRWQHGRRLARSGGPGEISGKLRKGIGYTKVTQVDFGTYRTVIRSKRKYAKKVEGLYPYFTPGVRSAEGEVDRGFIREYTKVLERNYR